MKRMLKVAVITFAAAGALVGVQHYVVEPRPLGVPVPVNQVDCPSEDSCTVDYRDGKWWVVPQRP